MTTVDRLQLQNKILGVLIRDARQAARRSPEECAAFLRLSASRYSDIEHGEWPMSLPELEVFAFHVDVPAEHFFGDQPLKVAEKQLPTEEMLVLRNRMVGARLRRARLAAGVTQEQCAREIGVPDSRISAYEYGKAAVPLAELQALAKLLEVPLETFLDEMHAPIARKLRQDRAHELLDQMPEDLREFVLDPLNADYLRTASRLSQLPTERLRLIAEALLEITY